MNAPPPNAPGSSPVLLPSLAGAAGLLVCAIVAAALPTVRPSLVAFSGSALLLVAMLALWLLVVPWIVVSFPDSGDSPLLSRHRFTLSTRSRNLLFLMVIAVATGSVIGWRLLGLRGPERLDALGLLPGLAVGQLVFAGGLFMQRSVGGDELVLAFLFRGRDLGYWRRYLFIVLAPTLGLAAGAMTAVALRPAQWSQLDAALDVLRRLGPQREDPRQVLEAATKRAAPADRPALAHTLLRLIEAQAPADRPALAVALLGDGDILLGSSDGDTLRDLAVRELRSHRWSLDPRPDGTMADSLGALSPNDAKEATLRIRQIAEVQTDPIVRAWSVGSSYCRSFGSNLDITWRHQERVWLRHVACEPDLTAARRAQRQWVQAHFDQVPVVVPPPAPSPAPVTPDTSPAPPGSRKKPASLPAPPPRWQWDRMPERAWLELTPFANAASFAERYPGADLAIRELDPQLFGDTLATDSVQICNTFGRATHLWNPDDSGEASWVGALVRSQRRVPGTRNPLVPFLFIARRMQPQGCAPPWKAGGSDMPLFLARVSTAPCALPPGTSICTFPFLVPLRTGAAAPTEPAR